MFGITNYPGFILAVLIFLAIPGPGLLAILAATGKRGVRAGFASTLGTMMGDWVHMLLAGIGVAAFLQANPVIFKAVQYFGAAYLIFMGVGLLRTRQAVASPANALISHGEHYFRRSLLITLLNPKAIIFYMAFFPLFIDPTRYHGALTLLAMAATVSLITILFCFSCVVAVNAMAGKLKKNPRISKIGHRVAGLFLIGFGIKLTIN